MEIQVKTQATNPVTYDKESISFPTKVYKLKQTHPPAHMKANRTLGPSWLEWRALADFVSACEAESPWSAEPDVKLNSNWLWKIEKN